MALERPLLRVAARETVPWVFVIRGEDNTLSVEGPLGNVLKVFSDVMKFDFQIVTPHDNQHGAPLSNGSWTGMIGMIYRGEADFSIGPFTISPARESVTDLTTPVYHSNVGILTPRPTIENDLLGFLKPFTYEVWLYTICSLVLISASMAYIEKAESKIFYNSSDDFTSKSWQWALKTLTQESSPWLPRKDGARVIVVTWLLASLVFMSCFSGILTAMLTVPRVTIPIDSLEDLVSQTKIPWRMSPGTFIYNFLMESDNIIHQKAVQRLGGTISNCFGHGLAIARGDYAIICEQVSMLSVMELDFSTTGSCHTYKARGNVYSNSLMAMSFKTNSPYFEPANNIIHSLKESGILNKWFDEYLTNATRCLRSPAADRPANVVTVLDIQAFVGPIMLLATGYLLSLMVFLWEIFMTYQLLDGL